MNSLCRLPVALLALALLPAPAARAQSALPEARPSADEVRALRQMVEKQGHQIDDLRQAVDELSKIVQLKSGGAVPAPAPATAPAPPPPAAEPPAPVAAAEAPPAPTEPHVERGEAVGSQHTVEKGETLTSIAKHYNISITDLHKANKVVDDRKLQIGQVLHIPTPAPAPKTAETPTKKKETP